MLETVRHLSAYTWLIHGWTTRVGGVSEPPHHSLNLSFSRPDSAEAVLENRQRVAHDIGVPLHNFVVAAQVHGTHVTHVTTEHCGRGAFSADTVLPASDALITAEPGLILFAGFADCTPLLFVDPINRAVGLAHAGWQGTLGNIAEATVTAMQAAFGSQPGQLLAVIGPAIGPCCYEVAEPVISRTAATFGKQASQVLLNRPGNAQPYLDLWRANRMLLEAAGLNPERITVTELCTACHTDHYFSHRREAGQTGRFAALIGISSQEDCS